MARKRVSAGRSKAKSKRARRKKTPRSVPKTISQAAYARRRGVTRQAVRKAVREGRIPVEPKSRIDPVAADLAWDRNTAPRAPAPAPRRLAGPEMPPVDLTEARTMHEYAKAKRVELELAVRAGELVPVSEVRDMAFRVANAIRSLLETMPDRLADDVVGLTDAAEARRRIRRETDRALDELVKLDPGPSEAADTPDEASA